MQKRMFKVLSPIERKDGSTYWMRLGNAMTNKDESINIYLDALPTQPKLQLRELTAEELREREERRAQSASRGHGNAPRPTQDTIPF